MVPTRLFVDWDVIDPVVSQYTVEMSAFFGNRTEDWASKAITGCDKLVELRRGGQIKQAEEALNGVCTKVRDYTPDKHVKCCGPISLVDAPFDKLHDTCRIVDAKLNGTVENVKEALKFGEDKICSVLRKDMMEMSIG